MEIPPIIHNISVPCHVILSNLLCVNEDQHFKPSFQCKMYQKKFKQISKEKKESDWQIRHWFVCAGKIHRLMIQINQVNCIHQCMHTQSCTNRRWRLIFNHYDYRPEINSFYKINFQWRCNQNHCEKDIHYLWQNEIK